MKNNRLQWLAVGFLLVAWFATFEPMRAQFAPRETAIAIQGQDPVLLVAGTEAQGKESIFVVRGAFKYLFATDENKAKFEKDPAAYEIQMDGLCARMGGIGRANPDFYLVHDRKIYIFLSDNCHKEFKASPEKYLEPVVPPASGSAQAQQKGRALIERAVAAAGGAEILDGLTSFQETYQVTVRSPRGERQNEVNLLMRFPDQFREVQKTAFGEIVTVVGSKEGFFGFSGGGRTSNGTLYEPGRISEVKRMSRNVLTLLRARKSADFRAVAVGAGEVDGSAVEKVAVTFSGLTQTLSIDPQTGRVLAWSYIGRGPQSDFGEIVQVFSDFRKVDGLEVPFAVKGTFKGEAAPERSLAIQSVAANAPVDPALFQKPAPPSAAPQQ